MILHIPFLPLGVQYTLTYKVALRCPLFRKEKSSKGSFMVYKNFVRFCQRLIHRILTGLHMQYKTSTSRGPNDGIYQVNLNHFIRVCWM